MTSSYPTGAIDDYSNASEITLNDMGKIDRQPNHNKNDERINYSMALRWNRSKQQNCIFFVLKFYAMRIQLFVSLPRGKLALWRNCKNIREVKTLCVVCLWFLGDRVHAVAVLLLIQS